MIDLTPSAEQMIELLDGVSGDALAGPTPCPDLSLGDLIDHIGTLAVVFAGKTDGTSSSSSPPPPPTAENLEPEWRARIAEDVRALAAAWREPDAWEGMTT